MDANRRDLLTRDRSWMNYKNASDRRKPDYVDGVNAFLDFAFSHAGNNEKIRCPCVNCFLGSFHDRKTIFYHLLARGILKDYNPWTQHGEDEIEEESIPYEDHMAIAHEVHPPIPLQTKKVSDSHEEKVEDGDVQQQEKKRRNVQQQEKKRRNVQQQEKKRQNVHQENDEDGNGDSPIIPPNVWRYVTAIGMSETEKTDVGGDVHQEDDDDNNGDQDASLGENDNSAGANHSDSFPNQSGEDSDFVGTEAEQVTAEDDSPENGNRYSAHRRTPRSLKLKKEMEKNKNPVKVELPANLGRVVGSNARKFVVEGSWLLKTTLPPNVMKWKDLNPNDIAKLLAKVKKRFIFPKENHVDKALLWQFKQWFRHWRSDLRRAYFSKHETYEEQLADRPPYIKEAHWKWLVDYWRGEKFQKLSAINSKVRKNQRTIACVGPTSIAQLTYELEKNKQSQQDPDEHPVYLKLFERQKRRIDGTWINKEAEDGYDKLVKLHSKQREKHGTDDLTPTEAYTKVFSRARSLTLLGISENPIALENSSRGKRKSFDQRVVEATACDRVKDKKLLLEQKSPDREAQNEESHSDPESEKRGGIHEQIRSIWEGLASSSTNA